MNKWIMFEGFLQLYIKGLKDSDAKTMIYSTHSFM